MDMIHFSRLIHGLVVDKQVLVAEKVGMELEMNDVVEANDVLVGGGVSGGMQGVEG